MRQQRTVALSLSLYPAPPTPFVFFAPHSDFTLELPGAKSPFTANRFVLDPRLMMFGTGPMLPILLPTPPSLSPSAKPPVQFREEPSRKQHHRYHKPAVNPYSRSLGDLATAISVEMPLMGKRKGRQEAKCSPPERKPSTQLQWTPEDIERIASEIYGGTITDFNLSLLGYWIRTSTGNYLVAKIYIRELGLDQGYNTTRISNPHVRKLLVDTHHVRPSEPPHAASAKKHLKFLTNSAMDKPRSKVPAAISTSGIFGFRGKNRTAHSLDQISSEGIGNSSYPPDTPDRPEPLSIRSRHSNTSNISQPANDRSRSVSTPFKSQDAMALPLPRCSVLFQDTISHPLLSPPARKSTETDGYETMPLTDEVTNSEDKDDERKSDLFADSELTYVDQSSDYNDKHTHSEHDHCDGLGLFQLENPDVASYCVDNSGLMDQITAQTTVDIVQPCHDIVEEEPFDVMDLYADSNDGHSILESISNASDHNNQTVYKYATPVSHTSTVDADEYHSHDPGMNQGCLRSHHSGFSVSGVNYHHPLPLRSYTSEAQMNLRPQRHFNNSDTYVTAMSPCSSHGKSSRHQELHRTPAYPPTPPTGRVAHDRTRIAVTRTYDDVQPERIHEHDRLENSPHHGSYQTVDEQMLDLIAFPIPPMRNPVGELPMSLHKVAPSSPDAVIGQAVSPESTSAVPSAAETYRAVTKVHMTDLLRRTRSRGSQLPSIVWSSLSTAEREWRENNGTILISIYGRLDMVLSDHDIDYINCIAQEIRSDGNSFSSNEWVLRMFRENI